MIITLDEQTRIRGTENCWQLERPTKCKKSNGWKPIGYYSTFDAALRGAGQREIRTAHVEDLSLAISFVSAVAAKYGRLFDDVIFETQNDRIESERTIN